MPYVNSAVNFAIHKDFFNICGCEAAMAIWYYNHAEVFCRYLLTITAQLYAPSNALTQHFSVGGRNKASYLESQYLPITSPHKCSGKIPGEEHEFKQLFTALLASRQYLRS